MVTDTRQTVRSALSEIEDSDLQLRIRQAHRHAFGATALHQRVFVCLPPRCAGWIYPLVDPTVLWPLVGRQMVDSDPRVWQAHVYVRSAAHQGSAIGIAGSWCCWRLMPSSGAAWAGG